MGSIAEVQDRVDELLHQLDDAIDNADRPTVSQTSRELRTLIDQGRAPLPILRALDVRRHWSRGAWMRYLRDLFFATTDR